MKYTGEFGHHQEERQERGARGGGAEAKTDAATKVLSCGQL